MSRPRPVLEVLQLVGAPDGDSIGCDGAGEAGSRVVMRRPSPSLGGTSGGFQEATATEVRGSQPDFKKRRC